MTDHILSSFSRRNAGTAGLLACLGALALAPEAVLGTLVRNRAKAKSLMTAGRDTIARVPQMCYERTGRVTRRGSLVSRRGPRMAKTIGNPGSFAINAIGEVFGVVPGILRRFGGQRDAVPELRAVSTTDIRAALRAGFDDFLAFRSDVIFACLLYPVIGLVLVRFAFRAELIPLIFPLLAGFALIGPVAAIGLYEMSRRRARGDEARWSDGFEVLRSPSIGPILALGAILFVIFAAWMGAAALIYLATLGPEPPAGLLDLIGRALGTPAGWIMTVAGFGVGFLFACLVLAISVVSFPLLIDRDVGLVNAIVTSVRLAAANPGPVALWGLIVAITLAVAAIPALLGLIVAIPILGHATWHLYRRAVPRG